MKKHIKNLYISFIELIKMLILSTANKLIKKSNITMYTAYILY
jgi:hypothetical protein